MASKRPVIMAVDDDPNMLEALKNDLQGRYSETHRILTASSGSEGLKILKTLDERKENVALFIVDQRMPEMTGVEFLTDAKKFFPEAKKTLLTAYSDTQTAIDAINSIHLDYYFSKPYNPPEDKLFKSLDDLLDSWNKLNRPSEDCVIVLGHRWSSESHEIKDFLSRHLCPYRWLDADDADRNKEIKNLLVNNKDELPFVIFTNGVKISTPTPDQIAENIGLNMEASHNHYDLIVAGGGPAGLAASVYGASEGLCTLLIERTAAGGQAGMSSNIENYLGFPKGLSGAELAQRAIAQAKRFGVEMLFSEIKSLDLYNGYSKLFLNNDKVVTCKALIIATGVTYRTLEVDGIDKFTGCGVYYGAAMAEALSCKNEEVFIVGGANSAGQAAVYFSEHAKKVTILVRGESLDKSMSKYLIDTINSRKDKIEIKYKTEVIGAKGKDHLEMITICNTKTKKAKEVPATALFVFIGAIPCTEWLDDIVVKDKFGFVLTGPDVMQNGKKPDGWNLSRDPFLLESSVPGIFAAGDVRCGSIKRVASSVGEGSIAVSFVHQHLSRIK